MKILVIGHLICQRMLGGAATLAAAWLATMSPSWAAGGNFTGSTAPAAVVDTSKEARSDPTIGPYSFEMALQLNATVIPTLDVTNEPMPSVLQKLNELSVNNRKPPVRFTVASNITAGLMPAISLKLSNTKLTDAIQMISSVTGCSVREESSRGIVFYLPGTAPRVNPVVELQAKIEALVAKGPPKKSVIGLEIYELAPGNAGSWRMRKDVVTTPLPSLNQMSGVVCYLPEKNLFYLEWDLMFASSFSYYGPFEGDPVKVLGLQEAAKPAAAAGSSAPPMPAPLAKP